MTSPIGIPCLLPLSNDGQHLRRHHHVPQVMLELAVPPLVFLRARSAGTLLVSSLVIQLCAESPLRTLQDRGPRLRRERVGRKVIPIVALVLR